mgnify:CR=1 FL=1
MPGFTEYFVNTVIDHNLRGEAYTPPTALYAKQHVGDPGPAGVANPSVVTTREEIELLAAAGGSTNLVADVDWLATATEGVSHISVWDDDTSGNCLLTVELEDEKYVYSGDTVVLASLPLLILAEA